VDLLEEQAKTRLAELVPLRYSRMIESPFSFLRGSTIVMAHDLAGTPTTGIKVQLCGDAHLSNFGLFASPERRLLFDLNDFDETLRGPWEWDLKRLAASLVVAGRVNEFAETETLQPAVAAARAYRHSMQEYARMSTLEVWYSKIDVDEALPLLRGSDRRLLEIGAEKARSHDSMQAQAKLTTMVNGSPQIVSNPPLIIRLETRGAEEPLRRVFHSYRRSLQDDRRHLLEHFRFVDLAHKVVGVGSVGTRCFIALLMGARDADPLFLQIKEAEPSVLEPYAGKSVYATHGQRVVYGQHLMQAASDIFLGWVKTPMGHFYVRQLHDWKGSAVIQTMDPPALSRYGALCGTTLARAHARTGDPVQIAAYLGSGGSFDTAIGDFAAAYADQTDRDHATLVAAVKEGRIKAATGL